MSTKQNLDVGSIVRIVTTGGHPICGEIHEISGDGSSLKIGPAKEFWLSNFTSQIPSHWYELRDIRDLIIIS